MNAAESSRPCSDRAASCSAATQPSVRDSECVDVGGREPELVDGVEVGLGLVGGEAEVAGAYLDELAAGPQAGERQGRVGPGADDRCSCGGRWSRRKDRPVGDVGGVGEVVVVEDQVTSSGRTLSSLMSEVMTSARRP